MKIRILQKICKIILIIIGIFVFFYCIKRVYPLVVNLDIKNIGSIITAAITLIVGLGAVLISQNKIKKRELAEAHREKKIELYNRFNDKVFELFAEAKENETGEQSNKQNLIDFMMNFKKDLIFRASPKVIKAVIKFIECSNDPKKAESVLRCVDDIYRAMRADIGLSNFGLDSLELLRIFLKNKSDLWSIK